jgi:hypothetical protein
MTQKPIKRRTPWLEMNLEQTASVAEEELSMPSTSPSSPIPSGSQTFHNVLRTASPAAAHSASIHGGRSPWANKPRGVTPTLAERALQWLHHGMTQSVDYATQAMKAIRVNQASHSPVLEFGPRMGPAIRPAVVGFQKRPEIRLAGQLLSWLRSRYSTASKKRLRVAEVTSLGEKRFVAIVSVEGREFLVGGGSMGVSLLTPLSASSESPMEFQVHKRAAGDFA